MNPTTADKTRYGNNAQTITTLEIAEMMEIERVARLVCNLLINKFTEEKNVLFAARYAKRFREMGQKFIGRILEVPLGELTRFLTDGGFCKSSRISSD